MDLYLASGSPRRAQLLAQIGLHISKIASDIDETPHENELALAYTERMAWQKSEQALALFVAAHGAEPKLPVLTADTSVAIDGLILGKPDNHAHAVAMLRMLSGRSHQVISSVVVWHQGQRSQITQTSEVTFRPLTEAEIQAYVDSGEANDKAGAYGIQGAAAVFIEHLSGSFSGVMGLPLFETAALLRQLNVSKQ